MINIYMYKSTIIQNGAYWCLSDLVGCWSSVSKEDYLQIFKCVSFWLYSFCGSWEGWDPVNRFTHTSWLAVVTPTDRPKSVRNC